MMPHPILNRAIIGTFFEYFDFVLFVSLAPLIYQGLALSQAEFSQSFFATVVILASFWLRPLFAYFWGYLADHHGLSISLKRNLQLMAAGTLAIGLTPSFSEPVASFAWLGLARVLQVAAFSGEFTNSLQATEYGCARKGHYIFAATAFGAAMANALTHYGAFFDWRLPFIISGLILIFCSLSIHCNELIKPPQVWEYTSLIQFLPFAIGVIGFQLLPTQMPTGIHEHMSQALIIIGGTYFIISNYWPHLTSHVLLSILVLCAGCYLYGTQVAFAVCLAFKYTLLFASHTYLDSNTA